MEGMGIDLEVRGLPGVMEMFDILIRIWIIWAHTIPKAHRAVHFRSVHFSIHMVYLN